MIYYNLYRKINYISKRNAKLETAINQAYHRYIFENNEIAQSLGFRKQDGKQIENIKNFVSKELEYYSSLYSKLQKNSDEYLFYLNAINSFQSQYQIIMAACSVDDPEEDLKIATISKEFDRLYVLLRLNSVYDSNSFQEVAYSLNEALRNASVQDYRSIFDAKIIELIKNKKGLQSPTVLNYNAFLNANYTNLDTRFLRYFLARIEKYITSQSKREMLHDVHYISTRTGYVNGYHIEHILSRNDTNYSYFLSEEEFETKRNQLGGLLLLKGLDNISSGNEEYEDKLRTYSAGLMWGHTLCADFYHTNKDMDALNNRLASTYGITIKPYQKFDARLLKKGINFYTGW